MFICVFFFLKRVYFCFFFFFFQAEDGIRDWSVTGVQTCALPIATPDARDEGDVRDQPVHGAEGRGPQCAAGDVTVGVVAFVFGELGGAGELGHGSSLGRVSRLAGRLVRHDTLTMTTEPLWLFAD